MSTPAQPPSNQAGAFQPVALGATLVMPAPLPNVTPFPLRPDEFLILRDGEMSEVRSLRDIGIGALVAGVLTIATHLANLDWDSALRQGRHPMLWTVVLFLIPLVALCGVVIAQMLITHMRTRSAYSRQIETIENNLGIPPIQHGLLLPRLRAILARLKR
jgi:hypothetical protein